MEVRDYSLLIRCYCVPARSLAGPAFQYFIRYLIVQSIYGSVCCLISFHRFLLIYHRIS
ncbi:hypothetical protein GLOIN_2v1543755 [Rhizophagus irregularis DAOM 181602=DAOM 197198]|uniref:Uncharacterized protein n=1 Tax=Rhizophagus irregularis (strain DAOM 181602 / DAOM 197198 / MUCL 43194) TaxID=747089 RepID=A0A2P4QJG5_RHIID|nr:hypothetical protein GLOIN_2v1543755 [Rhizophagus irregularis DAOM 181602=DAOM 197198]POG77789.1 hypothetical protein GLOIN_2v1543755 [Rhizophagus irregularis DAOM 181602=DAOM 197198]|eukprot:XP_025184655.1 hypothetical protein GLOIN_2v1543755 [Rhizophagus irregularis DAOM 181602=DAOM 197198]